MDIFIFLLAVVTIILSILMVIKFFQTASDVRKIRDIFVEFFSKNESKITSKQAVEADLNNPKVLENMLNLIEKQKA